MIRDSKKCVLYCLLKEVDDMNLAFAAFENAYPEGLKQPLNGIDHCLQAIAEAHNNFNRCCLITSLDYAGTALNEIMAAVNRWYLPTVLVKSPESQITVSPFEPVITVDRPFSPQSILHAIDYALELSGQYLHHLSQVDRLQWLSQRELDIVRLVTSGNSNESVSKELEVSVKTVEKHRRSAYEKLKVRSLPELVSLVTFQQLCGRGRLLT